MATVYEIEGNLITRVSRTVEQVGRLSDLLPSLTAYQPVEVGSLPRNTVYYRAQPATNPSQVEATIIVAEPPQTRRILFNESHSSNQPTAYSIALPYHLFWFHMRGSPQTSVPNVPMLWAPRHWGTAWMRRPFANFQSDLSIAPRLPNTYGDGRVCFGTNAVDSGQTMGQYINDLINTYWTSLFNTDLGVSTPYGTQPRRSLQTWERATAADANCWMGWTVWADESPIRATIRNSDDVVWDAPVPDSVEPVVPQVPRVFTFHSIQTWLIDSFTEEQRARMLWALQNDGIHEVQGIPLMGGEPLPTSETQAEVIAHNISVMAAAGFDLTPEDDDD